MLEALDEAGLDTGDLSGDLLGETLLARCATDPGRRLAHDSTLGPLADLLTVSPADILEEAAASPSANNISLELILRKRENIAQILAVPFHIMKLLFAY